MSNQTTIRKYEKSQVAPAESTGGAGPVFENDIQALFATLMVCDGECSIFPNCRISSLRFQARADGYCTDDLLVRFVDNDHREKKLLVQCKRTIEIKPSFVPFTDSVQAAWIDFQDAELFNKEEDAIALATGPLSRTDNDKLEWVFNLARHSTQDVFFHTIKAGKNVSAKHLNGYELIREIVAVQTDGPVDEGELYLFLRSFYILQPDMLYEGGFVSSFACSLLKRHFEKAAPRSVFNEIVSQMQNRNECGGSVSRDELVCAIQTNCGAKLRNEPLETEEETRTRALQIKMALPWMAERVNLYDYHLALFSLIGMWQETKKEDRDLVCDILQVDGAQLESFQQELIERNRPLMVAESGLVRVKQRRSVWRATAGKVSQAMIERFLAAAKDQFLKIDHRLDIDPDKRFYSDVQSGIAISDSLWTGLAEGLAILGVEADRCSRVELTTRDDWAASVVRACLGNATWKTWATLDDILPYLAEAAPEAYLAGVNQFLRRKDDGVGNLFAQESSGIMGRTYLGGFLEALQHLAWLPDCFATVLDILARLVQIDPGGQWCPRPAEAMQRILHPYGAHTTVEPSMRVDVVSALLEKYQDALWDVLVGLLPSEMYSYVDDANLPVYRRPENMKKVGEGISYAEAYAQFDKYGEMAVRMCGTNTERMTCLIESAVENWRDGPFQALAHHLTQNANSLSNEQQFSLWTKLREKLWYLSKHGAKDEKHAKQFEKREDAVLELVRLFEPHDPRYKYLPLFSHNDKFEEEDSADMDRRRRDAVKEIWEVCGTNKLLEFAARADRSEPVGHLFGQIASPDADAEVLPDKLSFDRHDEYWPVAGYVFERFNKEGWPWVEALVQDGWTYEQRAMLFVLLPFTQDTWSRLSVFLGEEESLYWRHVEVRGKINGNDVVAAVAGFLKYGCCYAASEALSFVCHGEELPQADLSQQILNAFVENRVQDQPNSLSDFYIEQMIKAVQRSSAVSTEDMCRYEWFFFEIFDRNSRCDFYPMALNQELATNPLFFHKVLELAFLPEKEARVSQEEKEQKSQSGAELRQAENAWRLLHYWRIVPGVDDTGSFSGSRFREWITEAFSLAKASGRLDVAKIVLAGVFIHAPAVSDFWMPHEIAELMEKPENEQMLRSYENAVSNSRGAHFFDKTMKEDNALAAKYREKAKQADRLGYFGLANAMRDVAELTLSLARMVNENHDKRFALSQSAREEREDSFET